MADGNGATSFERLIEIGIALSAERNINRLMEMILLEDKALTNADGGTLYIRGETKTDPMTGSAMFEPTPEGTRLKFEIMRTDSLNIAMGGTTGRRAICRSWSTCSAQLSVSPGVWIANPAN